MPHVPQKFVRVNKSTKPAYILQIAKANYKSKVPTIVFWWVQRIISIVFISVVYLAYNIFGFWFFRYSNDSSTCNWLSLFLNSNNVESIRLNGEMDWKLRRETFKQFQNGEYDIIICTSVAARGLDTCRVLVALFILSFQTLLESSTTNIVICVYSYKLMSIFLKAQHVVNYEFPVFIADYIHRCGRTGRLGSKVPGKVTNLISSKNEIALTQKIEVR